MATVLSLPVIVDPRLRERGRPTTGPAPAGSGAPQRLQDPTPRLAEALCTPAGLDGDSAVVTHGDIVCALLVMLCAHDAQTAHWGDGMSVPNGAVVPMRLERRHGAVSDSQP